MQNHVNIVKIIYLGVYPMQTLVTKNQYRVPLTIDLFKGIYSLQQTQVQSGLRMSTNCIWKSGAQLLANVSKILIVSDNVSRNMSCSDPVVRARERAAVTEKRLLSPCRRSLHGMKNDGGVWQGGAPPAQNITHKII